MFKLALLDLKRKKKSWRLLFCVMTLAYAFLAMMLIFYASLDRTEEAEREAVYGSWHVALIGADQETIERVKNHATVESAGISYIYGMVLDQGQEELGKIGTVDENTIEMENISLMQGRFPEKEGEVAVEMSSLTALGYSAQVNQQISVHVRVRNGGENEEMEETYNLVGIVQDYSAKMKGTTPDKKDYVSFFTIEKAKNNKVNANVVCRIKSNLVEMSNEVLQLTTNSCMTLENNYTYYGFERESNYQDVEKKGQRSAVIIGVEILFIILGVGILFGYKNSQNYKEEILYKLGIEKVKLNQCLEIESLFVSCMSFMSGTGTGIIFTLIWRGILNMWNRVPLKITIFLSDFIKGSLSIFLLYLILLTIVVINNDKILKKKNSVIGKKEKVQYPLEVLKYREKKYINKLKTSIILTLGISLMLIGAYQVVEKFEYYNIIKTQEVAEYEFGMPYNYYSVRSFFNEQTVDSLQGIYGVDQVDAFKILNYIPLAWKNEQKSKYATIAEQYWKKYTEDKKKKSFVMGIDSTDYSYSYYDNKIDEGKIDKKKFDEGNMVILYLPDLLMDKNGEVYVKNINSIWNNDKKFTETTIKIGEILTLNSNINVEVGGIIRDFNELNVRGGIVRPYTIIGSYELCKKLSKETNDFAYIVLYTLKNINYQQTEAEIARLRLDLYLKNNKKNTEVYFKELYTTSILWGIIYIFLIILMLYSVINKFTVRQQKYYLILRELRILGLSRIKLYIQIIKNIIWDKSCIIFISSIILWVYENFCFYKIKEIHVVKDWYRVIISVLNEILHKTPWIAIGGLWILLIVIDILLIIFSLKKIENF